MNKTVKMTGRASVATAWALAMALGSLPALAQPTIVPVEGVSYNVNASLVDNLKSLVGKKVYVTVDAGKTFIGIVKEVGEHLLHLEKLDQKDYFDALIRIDAIVAIDTRFRTYQR